VVAVPAAPRAPEKFQPSPPHRTSAAVADHVCDCCTAVGGVGQPLRQYGVAETTKVDLSELLL
jgi:hypothetical protein